MAIMKIFNDNNNVIISNIHYNINNTILIQY